MKHVDRQGRFKSGNPRCYFRRGQGKRIPLPDLPMDHPDWLAAYAAAAKGQVPETDRPREGTFAAAVVTYLRSEDYHALSPGTRAARRRAAEDIRRRYGRAMVADLETRHIRDDLARLNPHPANSRLKVWRAMCRLWFEIGVTPTDPARDVRPRRAPKSDGHTPWERADLEMFRARWPIGSPQRLAMELIYRTAAAIGDACRLGPGNVKAGWLTYTRAKSGTSCACPWTAPAPAGPRESALYQWLARRVWENPPRFPSMGYEAESQLNQVSRRTYRPWHSAHRAAWTGRGFPAPC